MVHFWRSTPQASHWASSQVESTVPERSMPSEASPSTVGVSGLAAMSRSGSTSVSHGRSVSPFHCEFLAFS